MSEDEKASDKVRLIPYDGVAPTRYLTLFKMGPNSRKRDGRVIRVEPHIARPKLEKSLEALPALEGLVVESLRQRSLSGFPPRRPLTSELSQVNAPDQIPFDFGVPERVDVSRIDGEGAKIIHLAQFQSAKTAQQVEAAYAAIAEGVRHIQFTRQPSTRGRPTR